MAPAARDLKTAIVLLAEDNPVELRLAQGAQARGKIACDLRIVSDGEEARGYLLRRKRYLDPKQAPLPNFVPFRSQHA